MQQKKKQKKKQNQNTSILYMQNLFGKESLE